MQTTVSSPTHRIVREYTSYREFQKDAQMLYLQTGYSVGQTSGMPGRSLLRLVLFFWPRHDHLVITYYSPTIPRPALNDGGV